MKKFTTILWDVDNTLLDFQYSQAYSLRKCFENRGMVLTDQWLARYDEINASLWKKLELGEVTKQALLIDRFYMLFEEMSISNVDVEAFLKEYEDNLGSVFCCIDDSHTICASLKGHFRQYVITNGVSSSQRSKLRLAGFNSIMDGIFISDEIGAEKPSQDFFEAVLKQIPEKDLSKILIVGDSLTSDIKGGVNLKIPTCWFRRKAEENPFDFVPDYCIVDLHEIYDILEVF